MDVIAASPLDAAAYYASSDVGQANDVKLRALISSTASAPAILDYSSNLYEINLVTQFWYNVKRTIQRYQRNPSTSYGRAFLSVAISLIFGAIFYRVSQDHSIGGLRNATSLVSGRFDIDYVANGFHTYQHQINSTCVCLVARTTLMKFANKS